jgi:AcrR family transcriptional regulator
MGRPVRRPEDPTAYELVVSAAIRLFASNGFERTTIREIAREAGVTPGGIYYHFVDKADILYNGLKLWTERLVEHVADATDAADGGAEGKMRAFVQSHVIFQLSRMDTATLLFRTWVTGGRSRRSVLPPEQSEALRRLERQHVGRLRAILSEGAQSGEFQIGNIKFTAFAIFGICEHTLNWFHPTSESDIVEISNHTAELAVRLARSC